MGDLMNIADLKQPAGAGDARAAVLLGRCFHDGTGVAKDLARAVDLYRQSARAGNPLAQCDLGACYATGSGVAKDQKEAVRLFRLSANQGHALALFNLAEAYRRGREIRKNNLEALRLLRQGVALREPMAMVALSLFHCSGLHVVKDLDKARDLARQAANMGCKEGIIVYGLLLRGNDWPEAVKWFRRAIDDPRAKLELAKIFYKGRKGVARDEHEAARLVRAGAAQGNKESQDLLKKVAMMR